MKHSKTRSLVLLVAVLGLAAFSAPASSHRAAELSERIRAAHAICRATVTEVTSLRHPADGPIHTRAVIQVQELFQGHLPERIEVMHRGGVVGSMGELDGHAPRLRPGEERLFFLSRQRDGSGSWHCANGRLDAVLLRVLSGPGAPPELSRAQRRLLERIRLAVNVPAQEENGVTDQTASLRLDDPAPATAGAPGGLTGLLTDDTGLPARFPQPDQGRPIPYLVDADFLPSGMTLAQAMNSVTQALAAWTEVTGVQFEFMGLASFGVAAPNAIETDGVLRIQLHDFYGYIFNGTTLGIGGRGFFSNIISPAGWATGGNVAGHEFHQATRGYVVMKHTAASLGNPATFAEVLCHEIGHALGMDHSSEDPDETDPELLDAVMYYRAHADGRGAALGAWDVPVIRQVHPPENTPPFSFDRIMDITTAASTPPAVAGVNEILLRGYDLQSSQGLTLTVTNFSATAGTLILNGQLLRYVPDGFISADRLPPSGNSFYDRAHVRFSDGTNASPPVSVRVLSYNIDTRPGQGGDGIPDHWMIQYFGNENPAAGPNRDPEDDADGDDLTNMQEFQIGTDPTDPDSRLAFTSVTAESLQWQAVPYHPYELRETSDFQTWTAVLPPLLPTNTTVTARNLAPSNGAPRFFRLYKVP